MKNQMKASFITGFFSWRSWVFICFMTMTTKPCDAQWLTDYSYRKEITIYASQVLGGSNHIDFPVLISIQGDGDLVTTGSGGYVENLNGYDIAFTSSDGVTVFDHDLENYDGTNGDVDAWLRIPSLSPSTNTSIFMYFGNSSIGSDPSLTSTWNANYRGVWHIHDNLNDATSNSNTIVNYGSVTSSAYIANGRMFDGVDDILEVADQSYWDQFPFTASVWVRYTNNNIQMTYCKRESAGGNFSWALSNEFSTFYLTVYDQASNFYYMGSDDEMVINTWYHIVFGVRSSGMLFMYVNGVLQTGVDGPVPDILDSFQPLVMGSLTGSSYLLQGELDEVRFSDAEFSNEWIQTSYNTQASPSTFFLVGALESGVLPIKLLFFNAKIRDDQVDLVWTTLSESNNDFFTVEKSSNGVDFYAIEEVHGAGNSNELIHYGATDYEYISGLVYYRLKQTDYDLKFTYSEIVTINNLPISKVSIYPCPASDKLQINLMSKTYDKYSISVSSMDGRLFERVDVAVEPGILRILTLEVSEYANGQHVIALSSDSGSEILYQYFLVNH
ncbi:MAG: hypothetical protein COB85_08005 [Bacteroidetes bacterium]|nr:MAG: hypothetical protein COB85_08005 [Bacteroidota bacterium]